MYNKVNEKFIAGLQAIVGKEHVYADPDTLDQYKTDEETDPAKFHTPEAVVAPGSTEEVAAIVYSLSMILKKHRRIIEPAQIASTFRTDNWRTTCFCKNNRC